MKEVPPNSASKVTGCATSKAANPSSEAASTEPNAPVQNAPNETKVTIAASVQEDDYGPFPKSNRRARRQFNDEDDANLLKGFKRHGTAWRAIRDDVELGFGMRHPTDLRDRFRIRYPEEFAKAGFKLKPKEARELRKAEEAKAQGSRPPSPIAHKAADGIGPSIARTSAMSAPAAGPPLPTTTSKPTSTLPTIDLVTDFTFDDDDGDRSPIILNRNILQWADENSTSIPTPTTAPASTQLPTLPSSDFLYNPFAVTSDGLHINPLATLKLPSTAHWSYTTTAPSTNPFATSSTLNPTAAAPPSLPPPAPLKHSLPATNAGAPPTSSARAQHAMRTPNLPNIVFPYVPSASARNAVHNLPAPADILCERQSGAGDGHVWTG